MEQTDKPELPPDGINYGGWNDRWIEQECLNGDLILEGRWLMTDGLYFNCEIGESPGDVF